MEKGEGCVGGSGRLRGASKRRVSGRFRFAGVDNNLSQPSPYTPSTQLQTLDERRTDGREEKEVFEGTTVSQCGGTQIGGGKRRGVCEGDENLHYFNNRAFFSFTYYFVEPIFDILRYLGRLLFPLLPPLLSCTTTTPSCIPRTISIYPTNLGQPM